MRAGQGIINGMGRQHKASYVTFVSFWGVGIPSVALFVFYFDFGIIGLWLGPLLASLINCFAYYRTIHTTQWSDVIVEAETRRRRDSKMNLSANE